jgi:DNA-binding NtrC family response regulator
LTSLLEIALDRAGFNVVTFNDPSIALEHFQPDLYDLVCLDITMPKIDGFELYKQIKKIHPRMKVCFLIASEMYRDEIREVEHSTFNRDLFLQKPIPTDDLIREINNKINSN